MTGPSLAVFPLRRTYQPRCPVRHDLPDKMSRSIAPRDEEIPKPTGNEEAEAEAEAEAEERQGQ